MKNKYRIVKYSCHRGTGVSAQVKFWWFPFIWFEMWERGRTFNVWPTVEECEDFIKNGSRKIINDDGEVLKTINN